MAFCTSYKDILNRNIRHIYSGLPTEIRFRQLGFNQTIDAAKRIHEQQLRSPERFDIKFLHYIPEEGVFLPKAPAFRSFSARDVDKIVSRLSKGTSSRPGTAESVASACPREENRSLKETCAHCQLAAMPDVVSRKRLDDITNRLLKPTVSSAVKTKMRVRHVWELPEVVDPCGKLTRPISQKSVLARRKYCIHRKQYCE